MVQASGGQGMDFPENEKRAAGFVRARSVPDSVALPYQARQI
jgi:hypothetical protein